MPRRRDAPTPAKRLQVLVVGTGLGGLSTAAFLRQWGFDPTLVTASTTWDHPGSGIVLWNTGVGLLEDLGVAADLQSVTTDVDTWVLEHEDGGTESRLESAHTDGPPFVVVERDRLLERLRARLPAESVRMAKRLDGVDVTESGPIAEFEGGVREQFDVVVGADGTHSTVRSAAFDVADAEPWGTASWSFRTERRLERRTGIVERWRDREGLLSVGPLPDADTGLFVSTTCCPGAGDTDADAVADAVRRTFDGASHPTLTEPLPLEADTLSGGEDYVVCPDQWAGDGVALVGDAAHTLPPSVTVGPSLTIEDAAVLSEELVRNESTAAALDRYETRRQRRVRRLARADSPAHSAAGPSSAADCLAVDDLGHLRDRRQALLRAGFARCTPGVSTDVV